MEINQTLHLTSLNGLSKTGHAKLQKKLETTAYNNADGYGFREVVGTNKYINSTLVKRIPTFIPQFEPETGNIVEQEIFLYSTIAFGLDFNFDLLDVHGSNKNVSKVISSLYPLMLDDISVEPINLLLTKVIKSLSSEARVAISRLVVGNFQYKEGITGRYDMRIDDPKEALQILKKYESEISKVSLALGISNISEAKITITTTGGITLKTDESDLPEILGFIKAKLFERKGK
jgi:hypothetical protein